MPATLVNQSTLVAKFDRLSYIESYLTESLDNGSIHDISEITNFYKEFPDFAALLPEEPAGRIIVPAMHVSAAAVGLFYQNVGPGFLLKNMNMEQTCPVFADETVVYKIRVFSLKKQTKKGFKVYECRVEAEKENGRLVGTYEMSAFQHIMFG